MRWRSRVVSLAVALPGAAAAGFVALVLAADALHVAALAGPDELARYGFGAVAAHALGGWRYASPRVYVASTLAEAVALVGLAAGLLLGAVRGRGTWIVGGYVAIGAVLLLLALPALADTPDCPYDQDDQIRVVREVGRRHPGGRVDEKDRRITWTLPAGGSIVFVYGGCADLGSIVTRTERRAAPLAPEQVFATALDLATRYWNRREANALRTGLTARAFQTETVDGRTYFHVRHEDFSQFYVEYEFAGGTSRVAIAWSRNF